MCPSVPVDCPLCQSGLVCVRVVSGLRVGGLDWHMGWELLVCGCNFLLFPDSKFHWKKTIIFILFVVHFCLMLSFNRSSSLFRLGLLSVHVHLDKQHMSLKVCHGLWYPVDQHSFSKIEPVFSKSYFQCFSSSVCYLLRIRLVCFVICNCSRYSP